MLAMKRMPVARQRSISRTRRLQWPAPAVRRLKTSFRPISSIPAQVCTTVFIPRPDRSLALAWQSLANDGIEGDESHAESLLRAAVAEFPDDPDILSALAYVEQKHGLTAQASQLYRRALAANPDLIDAAADLGVIEAETGHLREAVELWQGAFQRAPGQKQLGHEPGCSILQGEALQ
jgi:Flp pilus assembly protein TadD